MATRILGRNPLFALQMLKVTSDVTRFHGRRDPVVGSWQPGYWVATRGLRNTGLEFDKVIEIWMLWPSESWTLFRLVMRVWQIQTYLSSLCSRHTIELNLYCSVFAGLSLISNADISQNIFTIKHGCCAETDKQSSRQYIICRQNYAWQKSFN